MTLLRKAMARLGLAALLVGSLQLLLIAQGLPGLLWPALLARTALMLLIAPALVIGFWASLHLGIHLPNLLLVWGLLTVYGLIGGALARMRASIELPAKAGRRAFLASGAVISVSGYGVVRSYPPPELTRLSLPLSGLPAGLSGTKLVLLSDLHRGPAISREYLENVVERVNALRPDLILLPGDFVSKSSAYFADVTAILSKLRPRIASLATLGNHDHWEGAELAKKAIGRAGVVLLHNSAVFLSQDGVLRSADWSADSTASSAENLVTPGLYFAGIDDLRAGRPDFAAAVRGIDPRVPTILLSHNPDFAEEDDAKASSARIDLQLSGHTHGGQVILPGAGPVVTASHFGTKYLYGMVQGPRWPVFITRGVGASVLPLRIGAPPEIVVFDLCRA